METKIIEASDRDHFNWGKFMLGRFTDEWSRKSQVATISRSLLRSLGWSPKHLLVTDLSVGHSAVFLPRADGCPVDDVKKTGIYFCPLFQEFIEWLYWQDLRDLGALPDYVELAPLHMLRGPAPGEYRGGPDGADIQD